ncbi:COX15/CtaA family protein [Arundinibacter roseus]|uniref:Heme A synthase n=1 Tax=Arundinibacter roseus TaxID=2070510 RepID=A0A4R4K7U4_9BACT|nr:COX15/CtaA family protein [Arundinibacter roseus]TDB63668.1 heme A synthase [Arundinibacter roseus]
MINSKTRINPSHSRIFRRLALFTVVTVYLLIVAGGVVRSTGAGMGCPDWPKCFGSWIPPTEVSQLPLDYKEIYGSKLKGEIEFNAVKTWIEYLNRLLGAFTGLLIFATLLASIPYLKSDRPSQFYASLLAFILVGFQGWLGSKVVSTELSPIMVTLHMVVAIIIVFILLFVVSKSFAETLIPQVVLQRRRVKIILGVVIALSLIQIILGTQVREAMDLIIAKVGYAARDQWIDQMGISFYIHRSFSLVILAANVLMLYQLRKSLQLPGTLYTLAKVVGTFLMLEIATGIIMAYWAVPAFAQPIHLTLSILIIGLQFVIWLNVSAGVEDPRMTFDDRLAPVIEN